jgi:methionyl-tRNA formyltransferase
MLMRIILIGQAAFGKDALEELIKQGENIVGVITVAGKTGQPLVELAENNDFSILQPGRLKDPEAVEWVRARNPDLLVLAFVTDFVPKEMIGAAPHGGINYHPSLLPKYRGGSAMNWAIISGEKETGVTIHQIDEGVDTGPIIIQERVVIDADDTLKSLYFQKLYPRGIRMMADAVRLIREGKASPKIQDHSLGSFQPVIKASDVTIDWRQPTQITYDLIRGSNPAPGAYTFFRGEKLKIWEGSPCTGKGGPGEIIEIKSDQGFVIATSDGAILAIRVQYKDTGKISSTEFADRIGLNTGDRLGN